MKKTQLLKSAHIVNPSSPFHSQIKDILIENGVITKIEDSIEFDPETEVIDHPNLHVSAGWMDIKSNLREPGEEWKETLKTGADAAAFGGFTHLVVSPNTKQPLDSKNRIEYINSAAATLPISLSALGTLSHELKGEELSEMYEMKESGALGFTDDKHDVNTGLMSKALLYAKNIDRLIVSFPNDKTLSKSGQIHEGEISTRMGLKGIPALAETLRIQRDISLAEYHDSPIHFSCISTRESVEMVRMAKEKGLKVTCDVAAHQLSFTDKDARSFDSHYKVLPPFRTQQDIEALIVGLNDGTIDAICSDHTPHDIEDKKLEFNLAEFGIIGLETAFASILSSTKGKVTVETIIEKLTTGPQTIFSITPYRIEIGEKANLTLFDPQMTWRFEKSDIRSKSKNTPFVGTEFTGKALGIIC